MAVTWAFSVGGSPVTDHVVRSSVRIVSTGWRGLATASFRVQDLDNALTLALESEVIITADGTRVFGGLLRRIDPVVIGAGASRSFDLDCQDFASLLSDDIAWGTAARRRTAETDKARITWLLSTWGDKGVTVGAEVKTVESDMEPMDLRGRTLAECLDAICEETGATWYVDRQKRLHYFAAETDTAAPWDFTDDSPDGVTTLPYRDLRLPQESAGLVNAVWVRGKGISGWRTDSASIATWGRREASLTAPFVHTQRKLDRRGDAYLARHAQPEADGSFTTWAADGLRAGMVFQLTNGPLGLSAESFRASEVVQTIGVPDGRGWFEVSFGGRGRRSFAADVTGRGSGGGVISGVTDAQEAIVGESDRVTSTTAAGPNLVPNSSAERTDGWVAGSFTIGHPHSDARHGARTFRAAPVGAAVTQLRSSDFIPVTRTRDHWISVWSWMSAHTSGTARVQALEYDAGGTLLATTTFATIAAVEGDWTRHMLRLGDEDTDEGPAFQAGTAKIKLAADSDGAATFTWDLDAWQVEASGAITSYLPLPDEIADGIVPITAFASGIRPVEILAALPALPDAAWPQGAVVLLTTDDKLYRSTGTAWTAAVPTVDLTGQVVQAQIADAAISTAKFAAGIRPVGVGASLPSLPSADWPAGATYMLTTDGKLYRNVSGAWTAAVAATDMTGQIVGAQIADAAVAVAKIAAGAVTTEKIAAGAVTTEKLTVGSASDDAVRNGGFEDAATTDTGAACWHRDSCTGGATADRDTTLAGALTGTAGMLLVIQTATDHAGIVGDVIPVSAGDQWYLAATTYGHGKSTTAGVRLHAHWYDHAGAYVATTSAETPAPASWTRREMVATAPAGATTMRMGLWLNGPSVGSIAGGGYALALSVDDMTARKVVVSAVIADGAITTPKMVANSINGDRIAAGTLDASKIVADSITAGQIQAGAIGASEIAAGAVTAAKIAAGTITATEIAASTITGAKIAADTITGANIAAGTITTSELAADSVTAGIIAAGAVGASEIAANAVTADKMLVGESGTVAITNPYFRGGLDGWVADNGGQPSNLFYRQGPVGSEAPPGGSYGVLYHRAAGSELAGCYQGTSRAVRPGSKLTVSLSAWQPHGGSKSLTIGMHMYDASGAWLSLPVAVVSVSGSTFAQHSVTLDVPAGACSGRVGIYHSEPDTSLCVTDVRIASDDLLSGAAGNVRIDQDGVTIVNGKLVVKNPGGTTIIDGSSVMYRQFAKGTLKKVNSGTAYGTDTDTITAYGSTSVVPAWLGWRADSDAATGGVKVGSIWFETVKVVRASSAAGSGNNHDEPIIAFEHWGELACYLSALPGYPVMELGCRGASAHTYYANYHLLIETTI